jgi:hypothetical protein
MGMNQIPWGSAEKEDDDLARATKAFLAKDYKRAIEHAKQMPAEKSYVTSRIVCVSACAIKDNDEIREAQSKLRQKEIRYTIN